MMLKRASNAQALDFPWGRIEWLASQGLGNSETLTVGRVTIRAGHKNGVHRHPNCDEVLHLVRGRLDHAVEDRHYPMEAGDTISIPTGAWHHAQALGPEDAVMVVCYSSADRQTETQDE